MSKKILVLGSKGLVGSSLNRYLNSQNFDYEITASTRDDTDLFQPNDVKKLLENTEPDIVINAAAKVGGILYNDTKRVEFLLENLKINMNLLEALIPYKKTKLINLGSSCIYPLNAKNPINENSFMDGKLEPTNSPYAIAKIASIELSKSMKTQYGNNIINLMPTNLYGPNDRFDDEKSHVIPGLIHKIHKAKIADHSHFEVWGTGKPKREFLYVDDLSDFINFVIQNDINQDLLNVGSGNEITIKKLANLIKEIIGFEGELKFDTSKPDGNPRKLLDSSKINKMGWSSRTNLEDGIVKTYEWYKKEFNSSL